jgi:hypothetical protein
MLCCAVCQGLDAEIQSAWGDLKELSGMMQAHEGGLQDFKEVSGAAAGRA